MKTVVLTETIDPAGLDVLHGAGLEVCDLREDPEAITRAHAILVRTAKVDADLMGRAPDLEVVSKHGVGCDNIDLAHLKARGIPAAIAADANATSVAEHMFMLMLAMTRQLARQERAVREDDWHDRLALETMELAGRRLLIVGLGRIGRRVAVRAAAFGMEVLAYDPFVDTAPFTPVQDLMAALREADVLTLHVPLTEASHRMIDAEALGALKEGAYLVNCARGGIVDEDAVLAALETGRLRGYGTDVFDTEPVPSGSALAHHPRTIATPHAAAMSDAGRRGMAVQSAENVVAALEGRLDPDVIFGAAVWA